MWELKDEIWGEYFARNEIGTILDELSLVLVDLGRSLGDQYEQIGLQIWAHKTAQIADSAIIEAPCILREGAIVKPYAYMRGATYVGRNAVVGHAVEMKNAILLERAQAAHYNYVGDSIMGAYAHLGAGAILSNLRQDKAPVWVQIEGVRYPTYRRKVGALVGDYAEVGCNAVLNPGTVLARGAVARPAQSVKGYIK